jgi:hypothetical protein
MDTGQQGGHLVGIESACLLQHLGDAGDVEHSVHAVARCGETLFGLAIMIAAVVEKHDHIVDHQF